MAEILVFARNNTHSNPIKDRTGCYKRGMPVVVFNDGHLWSPAEGLPDFVVIKIPGVSIARVQKYIDNEFEDSLTGSGEGAHYGIYRRRKWIIRWNDLPQAAKNRLSNDGELIIKVSPYAGTFDYTWSQVKAYFRNQKTGLDETGNI